ncbi:MAG: hypothetical protein LBU89_02275 [Fibromonadaceae bacterium]|jgi:hypothetical protein|nr:hypothetical protein [Fibromonadaceae bacterium]
MKPLLLLPFLLFLLIGCSEKQKISVAPATKGITANIDWYNSSEIEFTISTPQQLAGLAKLVNGGNNFKGKTIKLSANIVLNDTANWQWWTVTPPENEWIPIGEFIFDDENFDYIKKERFNGTFDGNGFIVSGIYINNPDSKTGWYQGLFGFIGSEGTVKNLGISASYIKGYFYVGGLVGGNRGTIINSYSTNCEVEGTDNVIGGFVGENFGKIDNSHSTCAVKGQGAVGGFVGSNGDKDTLSIISNSYSIGNVWGWNFVGGFVGINGYGSINESFSISHVTGTEIKGSYGGSIGGFVGSNSNGTISNSYSTGAVIGKNGIIPGFGGFAGSNSEGRINNSYSIGMVDLAGCFDDFGKQRKNCYVGGLVGVNGLSPKPAGKISGSYYNRETSHQNDKGKGASKTTAQMKQKNTFVNWDFNKIWSISSEINNGYPHLLENKGQQ